jgi:hypothetical protein
MRNNAPDYPDSPGYMIPPGSVWNDVKERILVCSQLNGHQDPYTVELIIIRNHPETGKRLLEFELIDWPVIKRLIEKGQMQRCPTLEPDRLKK